MLPEDKLFSEYEDSEQGDNHRCVIAHKVRFVGRVAVRFVVAGAVLHVNVVCATPVEAVPLVTSNTRLAKSGTVALVAPLAVNCRTTITR